MRMKVMHRLHLFFRRRINSDHLHSAAIITCERAQMREMRGAGFFCQLGWCPPGSWIFNSYVIIGDYGSQYNYFALFGLLHYVLGFSVWHIIMQFPRCTWRQQKYNLIALAAFIKLNNLTLFSKYLWWYNKLYEENKTAVLMTLDWTSRKHFLLRTFNSILYSIHGKCVRINLFLLLCTVHWLLTLSDSFQL